MPKSGPATSTEPWLYGSLLRIKSGSVRRDENRPSLEPCACDPLQVDRGDDLVGVNVAAPQRHADAGGVVSGSMSGDSSKKFLCGYRSMALTVPRITAATAGETRCVRHLTLTPLEIAVGGRRAPLPGAS